MSRGFNYHSRRSFRYGRRGFFRRLFAPFLLFPWLSARAKRWSRRRPNTGGFSSSPLLKKKTRVVIVRNPQVIAEGGRIDNRLLREMVWEGVKVACEKPTPSEAWQSLFRPDDVVGIKVNCLAGSGLSSHRELADAIAEGLKSAGVKEEYIIIWDKTNRDLERAGFSINTGKEGIKCVGTNALEGGYEPEPTILGVVGSCFSTILTKYTTAQVSVPVLKDHDLAGVSIALKNFYGAIHNPNKYHDNNCDPYIAEVNSHPDIKKKVRLVICDALVVQYHGGPSYKAKGAWDYRGV
ncbi:MAG: DUF362 domain-containing protein, partial [Acidobacteriota bacterium]